MIELSDAEQDLLRRPRTAINYSDHRTLIDIRNKLSSQSDQPIYAECLIRLAFSIQHSRVPHDEKAGLWAEAANASAAIGVPSSELYEVSAVHFACDSDYLAAARQYDRAAHTAMQEDRDYEHVLGMLRNSRHYFQLSGDGESASREFMIESEYRQSHSKGARRVWLLLFKYVSSYGESPARVAATACIVMMCCALLFAIGGLRSSLDGRTVHSLPAAAYLSVITFSTLGYGDYVPMGPLSKVTAATEVLLGLFLTSLFLVTIVRKYSRT